VVGQEGAKRILVNQLKKRRISPLYVFYGPPGVGKFYTSKIFAQSLNCEKIKYDACGECRKCKEIEEERNEDFIVISPNKNENIGINEVKNLKSILSYHVVWLKTRVVVVKEVDKLTEEASNSFLKTLEEVPPNTVFILITEKIENLLPTIKSRAQLIRFRRLKEEELLTLCGQKISKEEVKLAMGSYTRLKKIISPEGKEVQKLASQFIEGSGEEKLRIIEKVTNLEDFLWHLEGKLVDKLQTTRKEKEISSILQKIVSCEEAYIAKTRNVNEKIILYWLRGAM